MLPLLLPLPLPSLPLITVLPLLPSGSSEEHAVVMPIIAAAASRLVIIFFISFFVLVNITYDLDDANVDKKSRLAKNLQRTGHFIQ
jgi:hypothetical protein